MTDKRPCLRCSREIDAVARICPFCNWDQTAGTPPPPKVREVAPEAVAAPAAPALADRGREILQRIGPRALFLIAGVALLAATFAIGGLVYALGSRGSEPQQAAAGTAPTAIQPLQPATDAGGLTLVPASPSAAPVARSVTSAPIPNADARVPAEFQRSDATALPSEEYARIAAQATQRPSTAFTPADPRTVTANPTPALAPQIPQPRNEPATPPRQEEPRAEPTNGGRRTNPVPLSQPLPSYEDVRGEGTVRLRLTVSPSGRVSEVNVLDSAPGITAKVIQSVQRWKFKPATVNGEPVEGTFTVDVSFNRQ
jgi:TonB family protein